MLHSTNDPQARFSRLLTSVHQQHAGSTGLPASVVQLASDSCLLLPFIRSAIVQPLPANCATAAVEQLDQWASDYPGCDWAVLAGATSGVVVLDVDLASLAKLQALNGEQSQETLWARTDGRLLAFYRYPPEASPMQAGRVVLAPGLIAHLDGSLLVLPRDSPEAWPDLTLPILPIPDWLRICAFDRAMEQIDAAATASFPVHAEAPGERTEAVQQMRITNYRTKRHKRYKRNRREVMRLIVFLGLLAMAPQGTDKSWAEMRVILQCQFETIDAAVQRNARREGAMLIRKQGLQATAMQFLPDRFIPRPTRKHKTTQQVLAKCPCCRSWKHKTIWPTREAAEEFSLPFHDEALRPYECPHGYGWHLGHKRKKEFQTPNHLKTVVTAAALDGAAYLDSI